MLFSCEGVGCRRQAAPLDQGPKGPFVRSKSGFCRLGCAAPKSLDRRLVS
ncbi:MAG: hypothetical protein ACI9K5_003599 [Gammaproteobacteria bacterium]